MVSGQTRGSDNRNVFNKCKYHSTYNLTGTLFSLYEYLMFTENLLL